MAESRLYKPPLPDPKTVKLQRSVQGQNTYDRNAVKRARRHAAKEADREPTDRIMQRTDLAEREKKRYHVRSLREMGRIMDWWSEFHVERLEDAHGARYFQPGGPLPGQVLLRQFLFWLADVSVGNVATSSLRPSIVTSNTNVSRGTLLTRAKILFAAIKYYNKALDRDVVSQTLLWIKGSLTDIANLNREPRSHSTAYPKDVEIVIKAIWKWESVATMKNFANMVALTLVINLIVDGASRIGELVPRTADDVKAQSYLKWKDLEFWVGRNEYGDLTIFCLVLSKWLKFHTAEPGEFKAFVCRLLSPNMVLQDSCRLLVILGLHFGYFKEFQTWEELMSSNPGHYGA